MSNQPSRAFFEGATAARQGANFACNPYPTTEHPGQPRTKREIEAASQWASGFWRGVEEPEAVAEEV